MIFKQKRFKSIGNNIAIPELNIFFIRFHKNILIQCVDLFRSWMETEWMGVVYREHNLLFSLLLDLWLLHWWCRYGDTCHWFFVFYSSIHLHHHWIVNCFFLFVLCLDWTSVMLLLVVSWKYSVYGWSVFFQFYGWDQITSKTIFRDWFCLIWEWEPDVESFCYYFWIRSLERSRSGMRIRRQSL